MQKGRNNNVIYAAILVVSMIVGFFVTKLMTPSDEGETRIAASESIIPEAEPKEDAPVREAFSYTNTFTRRETHKSQKRGSKSDTVVDVTYETHYTGYTQAGDTVEKQAKTNEVSRRIVRILKEREPIHEGNDDTPKTVPAKLTPGQFQALLNNTSDNTLEGIGSEDVSGAVRITVRNQKEGGKKVRNPRDVREKLETGFWRSARVISIGHDEQTGKITSAVIEPVYP